MEKFCNSSVSLTYSEKSYHALRNNIRKVTRMLTLHLGYIM